MERLHVVFRQFCRLAAIGRSLLAVRSHAERIDAACRLAAEGKLAARRIAGWLGGSEINEPEFRLLWLLAGAASSGDAAVSARSSRPR